MNILNNTATFNFRYLLVCAINTLLIAIMVLCTMPEKIDPVKFDWKLSLTAMADAFEQLLNDEQLYTKYQTNIRDALLNRHLWSHRVRQIVEDLTETR